MLGVIRCLGTLALFGVFVPLVHAQAARAIGVQGAIGCLKNPKKIERLEIKKPGVYENYLVDGNWGVGNRVKITADNVILRNCEIFNCGGNGVGVFAKNITIENCKIHHCLKGTFTQQDDAHGITGAWTNITIRNCEISHVSGDAVQFDPDRKFTGKVVIENCTFWTGPLNEDRAGFKKSERPGENGIDTKTQAKGERCELIVRNCYFHGWNQPGQIGNMAALNLKENVHCKIENCVLRDNEIAFRVRGPGKRGGAHVDIKNCAIYDSAVGVRVEDKAENLKIDKLGFGPGVSRKFHIVKNTPGKGFENKDEFTAPNLDSVLKMGVSFKR
ncbi:MAG: right-handed parallel beta-helix repeat-containing protein [Gemmataceae bacterium]|nr:right-handed parallel beta-helix repeat-containing protein [Gemmataceae bacterium]